MEDGFYTASDVISGIRKDLEWLEPAVQRAALYTGQQPTAKEVKVLSGLYIEMKAAHRQMSDDMRGGLNLEDAIEGLNDSTQRSIRKAREDVGHRILTAVFQRDDYDEPIDPRDIEQRANRYKGLDF